MSDEVPATRVETLRLSNYRRFEDTLVEFDPALTVLVASNGGGKTAVLDALVAAWSFFAAGFSDGGWRGPCRARTSVASSARIAPWSSCFRAA